MRGGTIFLRNALLFRFNSPLLRSISDSNLLFISREGEKEISRPLFPHFATVRRHLITVCRTWRLRFFCVDGKRKEKKEERKEYNLQFALEISTLLQPPLLLPGLASKVECHTESKRKKEEDLCLPICPFSDQRPEAFLPLWKARMLLQRFSSALEEIKERKGRTTLMCN